MTPFCLNDDHLDKKNSGIAHLILIALWFESIVTRKMYMPNLYTKSLIYIAQCFMYVVWTECRFYRSGLLHIYLGLMDNPILAN